MKRMAILIGAVAAAVIASKLLIENVAGFNLERMASGWIAQAGSGSAARKQSAFGNLELEQDLLFIYRRPGGNFSPYFHLLQ